MLKIRCFTILFIVSIDGLEGPTTQVVVLVIRLKGVRA